MTENFRGLLSKQEIEFEKKSFKGKLAGKAFKYSKNIDGLVRTRMIIFAMSFLVLFKVGANYLLHNVFDFQFLIERIIFAAIILLAGLLFNKVRILSILLAVTPLVLITYSYFLIPGQFQMKTIGFMIAMILLILSGIYHNIQSKKIKSELEKTLLENKLIEDK